MSIKENSFENNLKAPDILKNIRFLLVDDVQVNLLMLQYFIEDAGGIVTFAENGLVALNKVKENNFDVIIMDIRMPEMDGIEATKEIRKTENGRNIAIIGLSADVLTNEKHDCLTAGMNDFISKPLEFKKIVSVVNGVLGIKKIEETNKTSESAILGGVVLNEKDPNKVPINIKAYIERMGGNQVIAETIIKGFLLNIPVMLHRIEEALEKGDREVIDREAHSIKGGASNIFAEPLMLAAKELELEAKRANSADLIFLLNKVKHEYQHLLEFVEKEIH
jgi:CheY-like chemotaxis protein/HPt (histidine-containing phosphotransfer) domain-containing protein